ncbi:cocaine- and amphetamine-regulated transcript protein-like [Protopterus annectens]|uniref:cocaine- and amphetamine-regulated transcript protein-like n=1 Tax=Protopterus annectens TaxID=7888 RepID=UPI001CFA1CC7|nr:cocaine- and amphetamine-regulated transcript protein-like [Protopterus annectens]
MDSSKVLLLFTVTCSALVSGVHADDVYDVETRGIGDLYYKNSSPSSEKQLLSALQEVLEKLQSKRVPAWEKKVGQVPTCDIGEQCAVRKGARIGKLCDCPRASICNFFLLKCL